MLFRFEIPGELPTLNPYIKECRTNKYSANKVKQDAEAKILACIQDAPKFQKHVWVYFTWIRSNMRSDKDNVTFAKKFVLDALQKAGVIQRDSWAKCTPYDKGYAINKRNPRTIVEITDEQPPMNYLIGEDTWN